MSEYIERKAALEFLYELESIALWNEDEPESIFSYTKDADIVKYLKSIPAADVVERNQWIPVTERLPEADGFTLIFTSHGHAGVCYFTSGWWGGYDKDGIIHWMPLPEPPEEE